MALEWQGPVMKQIACLALLLGFLMCRQAHALITGGEGNDPLRDPGWPAGAAEIFNHKGRIAYWVGPPFGGGQWHSECKGDAGTITEVLKQFAKIDGKKQVIVHDGIGYSFWLDPNQTNRGNKNTKIDWVFTVWEPEVWKKLKQLPQDLLPFTASDQEPMSQIDIYAAGIRWQEVSVPEGLLVVDNRMSARGFQLSDGRVIEGRITDDAMKPLRGRICIQEIVPKREGGYDYRDLKTIETDDVGHWCVKNFGEKWCRLIAECDGYASRVIGHVRYDRQPGWESMNTILAPRGAIVGVVVNESGQPIEGAQVIIRDLTSADGHRYETLGDAIQQSDADGKFLIENLPHGRARLSGACEDYFSNGLGQAVNIPSEPVTLVMRKAAQLHITVEFNADRGSREYIAELTPEGGNRVGAWGGSAQVGRDNTVEFKGVPPGKYELCVHPNPSSDKDRKATQLVELRGGEVTTVVVKQNGGSD